MPAVSVLVPVFNSEAFLDKCLESLACQTLADLEVICVDDHSTDGSRAILDKRAAEDSRFKVISFAENRGPSAARNAALDAALGEYVAFVDSDDFVAPDFLEKLYRAAVCAHVDVAKGTLKNYDPVRASPTSGRSSTSITASRSTRPGFS